MSRIDDALKAWEESQRVPTLPDPAVTTSEPFRITEYPEESSAPRNGSRAAGATPPSVDIEPHEEASLRTASLAARHVEPPRVERAADVQARLVTGVTNALSLEQYRRLAAALHDIQLERGLKTVMVTSALPSEGKTLTLANLALTLSESYERRVLVIDADLRWPSIHTLFGLANGHGLSECLNGQDAEPALTPVSPRLTVLTAGRPSSAPLAGLSSPRMEQLLDACAAQFDWVLLDTPPVGLMPDAQVLARLTRAVVFVIGAGSTPAATVERAIAELGPDCVIGTVLNRVASHRIPDAGYYSQYSAAARGSR